jgi:hypothetical protein
MAGAVTDAADETVAGTPEGAWSHRVQDTTTDRALDAAVESRTPMRRVLAELPEAGAPSNDDPAFLEPDAAFDEAWRRAVERLGEPLIDDRQDRAAIDTWYPTARRFAAWPHTDGLVFLALEQSAGDAPVPIVVGHATDEEVEQRRLDGGHAVGPSPERAASTASRAAFGTILGADLVAYARRRPQGLNRISGRPRDRAIRWLLFFLAVAVLIVATGALIVGRQP